MTSPATAGNVAIVTGGTSGIGVATHPARSVDRWLDVAGTDLGSCTDLVERTAHLETVLEKAVEPLRTRDLVAEVRAGDAFMAGIQLRERVSGDAVAEACTTAGVLLRTIHENTLQICPPFVVTEDEISLIAETITRALDTYPA